MRTRYFTAIIEKKRHLTPTVLIVRLHLADRKKINFRAGQYIVLKIPAGSIFVDRPFSIASSPKEPYFLELLVKITAGGVASDFFERVELGSPIQFCGPKGSFRIKTLSHTIFFLTSGTGIAPLRSMIYDLLEVKKVSTKLWCFFFVQNKKELFLKDELVTLRKIYNNFNYSIFLKESETGTGITSEFASHLNKVNFDKTADFYLCGGSHFVHDMSAFLSRKKIPKRNIHFELFK